MKRPGYREALDWLARNDDCYWLGDRDNHGLILSVASSLVRDLWDVSDERLVDGLYAALAKVYPDHEALRQRDAVRAREAAANLNALGKLKE